MPFKNSIFSFLLLLPFLLVILFPVSVHSTFLKITEPNLESACEPGGTCKIKWIILNDSITSENCLFDFYLYAYIYEDFVMISLIANNFNVLEQNSIEWIIPLELIQNGQYFIIATSASMYYSTNSQYFWIRYDYQIT